MLGRLRNYVNRASKHALLMGTSMPIIELEGLGFRV